MNPFLELELLLDQPGAYSSISPLMSLYVLLDEMRSTLEVVRSYAEMALASDIADHYGLAIRVIIFSLNRLDNETATLLENNGA